jgi:hypothetical protein
MNQRSNAMTEYLISFPSSAMDVPDDEMQAVSDAARAVIQEAKDAGVFIFTGGLEDDVPPVLVAGDGTVSDEVYPESKNLSGGFAILELPSREAAVEWAAKIAVACRCSQEVREFQTRRRQ